MKKLFSSLLCILLSLVLTGQTVYEIIQESPNHTTLETLIDAAGISAELSSGGTRTFFAPDDEAFELFGQEALDELLMDPSGELKSFLLFHLYLGAIPSEALNYGGNLQMADGIESLLLKYEDAIYINQAKAYSLPINATNGTVYSINGVITPVTSALDIIANSPNTQQFYNWILDAGLEAEFSSSDQNTFIIYTDGAFSFNLDHQLYTLTNPNGMFERFLLNYIKSGVYYTSNLNSTIELTGASGYVNEVNVIGDVIVLGPNGVFLGLGDISLPNGVAHFIDMGILAPFDDSPLHTMEKNDDLSIYRNIISMANYEDVLTAYYEDGLTVIAPSNNAFESMPQDSLDALLNDTIAMQQLIERHLVEKEMSSGIIANSAKVVSVSGDSLFFIKEGDAIKVNNIPLAEIDFLYRFGYTHVVNQFIPFDTLPSILDIIVDHSQLQQLKLLVAVSSIADDLDTEGPYTLFAPNDSAFIKYGAENVTDLLASLDDGLTDFLNYHLLEGTLLSNSIDIGFLESRLGENIEVTKVDDIELNNVAFVIVENIVARNGIVHIIDAILVPPSVSVKEQLPLNFTFNVVPNPANDFINIELDSEAINILNLECYDQLGRLVRRVENPELSSSWDIGNFGKGNYFLKLNTDEGSAVRVFVVQRTSTTLSTVTSTQSRAEVRICLLQLLPTIPNLLNLTQVFDIHRRIAPDQYKIRLTA